MSQQTFASAALPDWLTPALRRGVLSRLPRPLVAAMLPGSQRAVYTAGTIVPGWEERPWAAILLEGTLRVFLPSRDGEQITLRYLRPGDVIGSIAGASPSLARGMEAVDRSELLHLDAARLEQLARAEAPLAFEMLRETTSALRLAHRAFSLRAFGTIRVRVANAILERAAARGPIRHGTVVQGTQQELAVAAGTVREVVASAVQALKREGALDVRRGALVIVDPARLAQEAQAEGGFWPPPDLT
jgi:CRP/FNR family transcriptional regulator, cyclic AMP receptor protein